LQKVFAEASVQTDKVLARRWCDIRDSDSEWAARCKTWPHKLVPRWRD
jgi:hypothetical protein